MALAFHKPLICPVLIGRVQDLTHFRLLVKRVKSGEAQVVLLSGEAGIDKSRLVAEVKASAAAQDFLPLEGQSFQTDSSYPYAPLLDLFRAYFARLTPTSLPDSQVAAVTAEKPKMEDLLPGNAHERLTTISSYPQVQSHHPD